MATNVMDFRSPLALLSGVGFVNAGADGYLKKRDKNWFNNFLSFGAGGDTEASTRELGRWFKDNYLSRLNDSNVTDYINSLDDETLGALMSQYYDETKSDWLGTESVLDINNLINDINKMSNVNIGPSLESYLGDYANEADQAIDNETQRVLALYDQNLARQTNNYNAELENMNRSYNDYARQVLANDYNKNAQLMGTVQQNMDKARKNALEAGANAGLRIASNVNTLLSAQNKQAATSLETSNQLAQAMMNQRNAASSLRGDYNNMLTNDTNARAGLESGKFERKLNARNSLYDSRLNEYNTRQQINTEKNGNYTSNPFYDSYTTYKKANNY